MKDFGVAIRTLKNGARVCRTGWNGKDMCLASQTDMLTEDWVVLPNV